MNLLSFSYYCLWIISSLHYKLHHFTCSVISQHFTFFKSTTQTSVCFIIFFIFYYDQKSSSFFNTHIYYHHHHVWTIQSYYQILNTKYQQTEFNIINITFVEYFHHYLTVWNQVLSIDFFCKFRQSQHQHSYLILSNHYT